MTGNVFYKEKGGVHYKVVVEVDQGFDVREWLTYLSDDIGVYEDSISGNSDLVMGAIDAFLERIDVYSIEDLKDFSRKLENHFGKPLDIDEDELEDYMTPLDYLSDLLISYSTYSVNNYDLAEFLAGEVGLEIDGAGSFLVLYDKEKHPYLPKQLSAVNNGDVYCVDVYEGEPVDDECENADPEMDEDCFEWELYDSLCGLVGDDEVDEAVSEMIS